MLFDIDLQVELIPASGQATTITRTNYKEMYYSCAQQLAHHTSSGCPMRVGDLLGSGTISGPAHANRGSMLELSWSGKEPIKLANGDTRSFIEDGDIITISGCSSCIDYKIGFGQSVGRGGWSHYLTKGQKTVSTTHQKIYRQGYLLGADMVHTTISAFGANLKIL